MSQGGKQGEQYAYGYNFNVGDTSADRDEYCPFDHPV